MTAAEWKVLPFEAAVQSRGSGSSGLPQKEWLQEGEFPVIGQGAEDIEGWTNREDLLLMPTPAMVLYGGHTRRAKHVSRPFVPGPNVKILQPGPAVDSKFLFYFLTQLPIESKGYADHFPIVRKCHIPVPGLIEQKRIVCILDEAFAGIATAKANTEKNLQNSRAIFESHLQSVFTQCGDDWQPTTLGAQIDLLVGFAFRSAQYTESDNDVRLLRGDNIVQGCLRWDEVKRWPLDDIAAYERYWLREGDVVLAMDRPWVKAGLKRATICATDLPCLLVQRTACLRSRASFDSKLLMHLIGSDGFIRHILGVQTGSGVPHISGQQIKDFEFALPPLAEQRRLAHSLEILRAETQRLESLYQRKLAALDALKKSLLHQAFSGHLWR